jgi:hypothetical protein
MYETAETSSSLCLLLHFRVGYSGSITLSHHHGVVLPQRARRHTWYVRVCPLFNPPLSPSSQRAPCTLLFSQLGSSACLGRSLLLLRYSRAPLSLIRETVLYAARVAHLRVFVWDANIVYDVSSCESFEALPRWLDELENYVPAEVVKIVVGNKLDKVKHSTDRDSRPIRPSIHLPALLSSHCDPVAHTHDTATFSLSPLLGILPPLRCRWQRARRLRGARGASRRSIRKDGGGRHRGIQRRRRADDRYALAMARGHAQGWWWWGWWSGGVAPAASATTASGPHAAGRSMPGNVDLSEAQDEDASGTCMC